MSNPHPHYEQESTTKDWIFVIQVKGIRSVHYRVIGPPSDVTTNMRRYEEFTSTFAEAIADGTYKVWRARLEGL